MVPVIFILDQLKVQGTCSIYSSIASKKQNTSKCILYTVKKQQKLQQPKAVGFYPPSHITSAVNYGGFSLFGQTTKPIYNVEDNSSQVIFVIAKSMLDN